MDNSTARWWEASTADVHSRVVASYKKIMSVQALRLKKYAILLGMYEGKRIESLADDQWCKVMPDGLEDEDARENIVKSIVDAAVAELSSVRPRPMVITNAGDHAMQQKARRQTLLIEGVINEQKGYKTGRRAFRDSCVWDGGMVKVYADHRRKRIRIERILYGEIAVDDYDGKYGNPRSMIHARTTSKGAMLAEFESEGKESIISAADFLGAGQATSAMDDPITILEAVHLPSHDGAADGRHIICVTSGALQDRDWKRERFPWLKWHWKDRMIGWHGMGMIEDLVSFQKQSDFHCIRVGRLMNSMTTRLAIEEGSNVSVEQITNDDLSTPAYIYSGTPPIHTPDPGPSPELMSERDRIRAIAHEQAGISQLMAGSKKPGGLNSGEALRQFRDWQSRRFQDIGLDIDDNWIEIGDMILDAAENLRESTSEKVEIQVPTAEGKGLESVCLTDVERDRTRYVVTKRAAGLLPREPAGRLSTIQELVGAFPQAAPLLAGKLDNPDVDDAISLLTAPADAIRYDIDMLSEGKQVWPEPFIDLALASTLVLAAYQRARNNNASEQVKAAYQQYLVSVHSMIEEQKLKEMAAQAGQMPPAAMPGGPGGGPGPMPGPM